MLNRVDNIAADSSGNTPANESAYTLDKVGNWTNYVTKANGTTTLNQTLYYTEDANFNVTGLVNTSGAVVERYAYSPYGQVKIYDGSWNSRTSSNYSIRILYAGYRWIQETGLYDVRHRMYNPALGKWMQRDPLNTLNEVFEKVRFRGKPASAGSNYADGMNLYQYVSSDPLTRRDSSGLGTGWDPEFLPFVGPWSWAIRGVMWIVFEPTKLGDGEIHYHGQVHVSYVPDTHSGRLKNGDYMCYYNTIVWHRPSSKQAWHVAYEIRGTVEKRTEHLPCPISPK